MVPGEITALGKASGKKPYSLNDWKLQYELLNSIKKVKNYIAKISDDLIHHE